MIYSTGTWQRTHRSGLLAKAPVEMLSNEPIEYEFACVVQAFRMLDMVPFADDRNQLSS